MEASASAIAGLHYPLLIGDVGGTNARFALLDDAMADPVTFPAVTTAEFDSLQQVIQSVVLDRTSVRPQSAIIAVAGLVTGDEIELTNRGWIISPEAMLDALQLDQVVILNDFEAQALAVTALQPDDVEQIGGGESKTGAACAVLGPGTGLGVAGLIRANGTWLPVAGEGGHVDMGPRNARETAIFAHLETAAGRVSAEQALSGRGLANLYAAICQVDNIAPALSDPAAISSAALSAKDTAASEALALFATLLGRVAGDMALIFMAGGGVYLTGGIAQKILPALHKGGFRAAFEDKYPHQAYMAGIPVRVVTNPLAALTGIVAFARNPGMFSVDIAGRHWSRNGAD